MAIGRQMSLKDDQLEVLRLGSLLHDIGKIGVSDNILRKPGPLTTEEYELIKQHPGLGARILRSVRFLADHIPIVELHHERPDGKGYPHGLAADEIPMLARIAHVADAFDAMTSARAYRSARGPAKRWPSSGVAPAPSSTRKSSRHSLVRCRTFQRRAATSPPDAVLTGQPRRLSVVGRS